MPYEESFGSLVESFQSGRLREVREHLSARSIELRRANPSEVFAINAELDLHEGRLGIARAAAEKMLTEQNHCSSRAVANRILAELAAHELNLQESLRHFEIARRLARDNGLSKIAADIELSYSSWFDYGVSHEAVFTLGRLRSLVTAGALPRQHAELHLLTAFLEIQRGCVDEAIRHSDIAHERLVINPNLRLQTELHITRCEIALLLGNLNTAAHESRAAIKQGERSGYLRSIVRSLITEGEVHMALGAVGPARARAAEALKRTVESPHLAVIVLEHLARVENAIGNRQEAQIIGDRALRARSGREYLRPDAILAQAARVGLSEDRPQFDTADDGSEASLPELFRQAASGGVTRPDSIARSVGAAAKSSRTSGDTSRAAKLAARSNRIAQAIAAGLEDGLAGVQTDVSTEVVNSDLEDALALLDLGGYPHLLGRETYTLLKQSGEVRAAALVATRDASPRCVMACGWSEDEVLRAAGESGGVQKIKCGTHGDEVWEVIVQPEDTQEGRRKTSAVSRLASIAVTLQRVRREENQRSALWPATTLETDQGLWASLQMMELLSMARRIAPSGINVLLTGETGTGKEVLARAIHRASDRGAGPFVPFHCSAVPREMLDSQLFGYRRGAFSGANEAFDGVSRAAAGGTLFLDEIGDLSLDLQPKLLRFLETHEVHGVGEPQPVKVDVRVVAASNADLESLVREGRFREDLFYRLKAVRLHLPPLRERREEIPSLVEHYLQVAAEAEKKGALSLEDETQEYLLLYSWPGNVRQLVNETNRLAALADPGGSIPPSLLSPEIQASRRTLRVRPGDEPEIRIRLDQPLNDAIDAIERVMVVRALDRAHGNFENAARLLGISRKGLFLKRRRWGMQRTSAAAS